MDTPKGSRKRWTLVGAGPLEPQLDQINQATKTVVDTMLSSMGV